jgi:CheY-like chemotaxis protein
MVASYGEGSEALNGPRRVLVVDDDVDYARGLGAILESAGYEVRVAFDATAALGLTAEFLPDFAIVDIWIPIVDGFALVAIFRAGPALRSCTFIAVSGTALDPAKKEKLFDHFFLKPLQGDALIDLLAQAMV